MDEQERRLFVKGLTCNHKHIYFDYELNEFLHICDKNNQECLISGQCPETIFKGE